MPAVIDRMLNDYCVYWPPLLPVDDNGQVRFSNPVELRCRWVDETVVFMDRDGNEQTSNARVRLASDVVELGVLWHGRLTNIQPGSATDPFLNNSAWEIRKFRKVPDRRNDNWLRIAML